MQIITEPTRIGMNSSTLRDDIYSNNTSYIKQSGVIRLGLSDHDLIYIVRKKINLFSLLLLFLREIIKTLTLRHSKPI